ncbi:MAG: hypothetical protein LBV09_04835 [Deferribacteraceae bacterium]|jgi:PHD/YefM family antitoxin component YafN of YafNO toxin-antitoxin module|nr:hypothetical protein [Deferribacteraceae bacterium]
MININVADFGKNLDDTLERTIQHNEPVNVSTKDGNVVIISESDYNGLLETLTICSCKGMKEKVVEGLNTPLNRCMPESEIEW